MQYKIGMAATQNLQTTLIPIFSFCADPDLRSYVVFKEITPITRELSSEGMLI